MQEKSASYTLANTVLTKVYDYLTHNGQPFAIPFQSQTGMCVYSQHYMTDNNQLGI